MENQIIFIKGLDVTNMVDMINKLNKKMQAKLLGQIELLFSNEDDFRDARKLILDNTNDLCREIVRTLIGDVEM